MADDIKRFVIPVIFSVTGIIVGFWMSQFLAAAVTIVRPGYDLVEGSTGYLRSDTNFVLMILFPIFFIEFLLFTLPIAFFMLLGARIFRVATYDIDVMRIGRGFDWVRIMKRSAIPAFFALSLGELVISLLNGVIFWLPPIPAGDVQEVLPTLHPLLTLLGGLIALVASIALFAPTWTLNDAGIVSHVKSKHLEMRRCPDTEGVGRWYSNLVGGFGLLAFPIAMFHRYFYLKFFVYPTPLTVTNVLVSLGWTIGLPIVVIAFILPIVMLNEITIRWMAPIIQRIAKRLGASDVQFQYVGTVQPLDSQMIAEMENLSDSMEQSEK
ncbi:MAG: hypothetical protein ACFFFK_08650 [Candidatus Thorarchaeota archaeon]